MSRTLLAFTIMACLCGCVHDRQYQRPALPVAANWPGSTAGVSTPSAPNAADVKWQDFFTDKTLQSVIELALANNRDLRMAALNVEKVHALYRIQRAQQFPTISAAAEGQVYRTRAGSSSSTEQYSVGFGVASWELDLFGRVRSLKRQALEQYLATEQARSASQIALVSAVAATYLSLAGDRDNLRLAETTLKAQQASYDLILRSRNAGIASDLDLRQAQTQVEAARVDVARYTAQVELDGNALTLLVGARVAPSLLPNELGSDNALKDISPGLPSETLLGRPDIVVAEHQLKAAYANIGAARAAYFPRITLTGAAGFMSSDLSKLFTGDARGWTLAPQIVLPLFDAGARQANAKAAQADRDIAIAAYEKTIQSAFREVSDSLTLRTWLIEQEKAQQSLVDALDATYRLSEARYKAGIDSYLSVLVAQRTLYAAQQGLVSLRMARMTNLVTLYKVLGGGA